MNEEDEIDDAVMANFDGLVDGMRAKRLGAEMPQEDLPEAPMPDGQEDPADEEALLAMFGDGGMSTDPAAGERPVDEFDGPDSDKWGGSGGGPMKKMGGGMMGGG